MAKAKNDNNDPERDKEVKKQETDSGKGIEEILEQENMKADIKEEKTAESAEKDVNPEAKLKEDLATIRQDLEASKDKYIRLMAEFDNYKRRTSREFERCIEMANERLILDLLDVRENFERGLNAKNENGNIQQYKEGMRLIFVKFDDVLKKHGLATFGASGETFDPNKHDAMMRVSSSTVPENDITEVYEKGYTLKNQVIRHAKVLVSSGAPDADMDKDVDNQRETDPVSQGCD